ncbi:MAG: peptidase M1, partial [Pseudonocardiales bacterium]|nr:peptidase M1 [Pseudonocardiales bacterium]
MRRLPVVLALAGALAGCSAGGPQPTAPDAAPASSTSAPADPIPPVRDPKN